MNHESPGYKDVQKSNKAVTFSTVAVRRWKFFHSDLRIQASALIQRFNMWWEASHSIVFYDSKHKHGDIEHKDALSLVIHLVLSIVYKFSSYLKENTPCHHYKDQSVNSVQEDNSRLL